MRKHHISFKHAWQGLLYVFKTQPNFRVHLFFSLLAISLAFLFNLKAYQWVLLFVVIGQVFIAELLNTSLEAITDLVTQTHHRQAKIAKDVAAAMVLITSIISLIIGAIIFLPHIINIFIL